MIDLSAEIQKEFRQIYHSLSEILRHFWATFPPTTPLLTEKASRMIETLHRFNQVTYPESCQLKFSLFN